MTMVSSTFALGHPRGVDPLTLNQIYKISVRRICTSITSGPGVTTKITKEQKSTLQEMEL
jgi:hypothetical protein